ncbi:MAG TPA: sulfatase-like hydrolase/transferase [Polyangiales bacterium]|nr:sulfatase-like hydrolase/transferase [Polyangiales bacterium]
MPQGLKKQLWFALKCLVSAGIIYLIFQKIWQRQDADKLVGHLRDLRWGWVVASALSLLTAITCGITRWNRLLAGQGIHAPVRHLVGTFMIGRFFGAVTPGGLGLGGYRVYDIAKHTGKTARSVASVGIEMVLGNLAVGLVALISCSFGMRYIGESGLALAAVSFGGLIAVTFTILWKPRLVRLLSERLPAAARQRLQNMVDAVCAYEGKPGLLIQSELLSMGVHVFNGLIYVCAAKGLGVELPVTELFFVSILQNVAAHVPISINGVGLREAAAVGLYTIVGVPPELSVLIPIVGFSVEMAVSSLGGLILLARRADYAPVITVEDAGREDQVRAQIERVPEHEWPDLPSGIGIGLSAGLLSGLLVGLGESWAIAAASHGRADSDVWAFGVLSYALVLGGLGGLGGGVLAFSGRWMQRRKVPEAVAFAQLTATALALFGFVIGLFRVQRDVYQEELVLKSAEGLMVLGSALAGALVLWAVAYFTLRALATAYPRAMSPVNYGGLVLAVAVIALVAARLGGSQELTGQSTAKAPATTGGNVLYIVVDTLRADHLPGYGYSAIQTPALDAFAKDAVRFEHAYANASWTRPSFASLMTGRYASSHGVMSKSSGLPDEAETIAEVFSRAGYTTGGVVTNYNIAPFFNFQQGFDEYHYLAPNFLFGASDTAAKLSLLQIMKRVDEKVRAATGSSRPGSAYQDAEVVNAELLGWLDKQKTPWLGFVGYMDPHDPYYEHPYNGVGYSRAAHVKPDPSEAEKLRQLYDGEVTFWDGHFGALVAELKKRNLYDALTIVVTADHGEEFMEHGGFWHGTTLYDEQLHVPLYVKLPNGERAGTKVAHWVESVDVMPTLLTLAKLPIPSAVQGSDLFRGKPQTFAEESHEGNVLRTTRVQAGGQAWKVISANAGNPRGLKERELYRVDVDPGEHNELSGKDGASLASREQELTSASDQARTGALKAREVNVNMDQAAQERLKALGYANE